VLADRKKERREKKKGNRKCDMGENGEEGSGKFG